MTLLLVLGCLLGYVLVGLMLARLDRPRAIRRATARRNNSQYETGHCPNGAPHGYPCSKVGDICRSCVMSNQYLMVFCWPVFGIIAIVNGGATLAIERVDPRVHQLQQKRIADLERELGVR